MDEEIIIRLFPDGDAWCALIGENIEEGICGFGSIPPEALEALAAQMKEILFASVILEGKRG
jgi:hypothetical protein